MNQSESITNLMDALRIAQGKFDPVLRDATNPLYKKKYATLSGVIAATQPTLAENGLVISQPAISDLAQRGAGVTTLLFHSSGEFMSSDLLLPAAGEGKNDTERYTAQTAAAAITYARRNAYLSIIGISPEDDDGNAASGHASATSTQTQRPTQAPTKPTTAAHQSSGAKPTVSQSSTPTKTQSAPTPVAPTLTSSEPLPTEAEMTGYREKFRKMGIDLAEQGGLKASRGLPINRKTLIFLFEITKNKATETISKALWDDFFARVDKATANPGGWKTLAELVENANTPSAGKK